MILIARSAESLRETALLVEQKMCEGDANGAIATSCHAMDLSDLDTLPETLQGILGPLSGARYDACWLINNAGSLGPLGLASSSGDGASDLKQWREAVDFNVTSSIWVSSQFAKTFLSSASHVRIVNISSLCAMDPFPTMSVYCAGKAGRNMFHSVLAKEHSTEASERSEDTTGEDDGRSNAQRQRLKTLNYAPGPCDTEMTDVLAGSSALDAGLHKYFTESKQEHKLVRPRDTAEKLVNILSLDEYESGSHVDYFDI